MNKSGSEGFRKTINNNDENNFNFFYNINSNFSEIISLFGLAVWGTVFHPIWKLVAGWTRLKPVFVNITN